MAVDKLTTALGDLIRDAVDLVGDETEAEKTWHAKVELLMAVLRS